MDERERFEKGLEVRRNVLGDKHVNKSFEKINSFTQEFQDLVTRHDWGEIWTRPGLPRHTRGVITLAMLIALQSREAITLHFRGPVIKAMTRDRLQEEFM